MDPIQKLMAEHKNILIGISLLEVGSNRLESGENVSPEIFRNLIDFIRNYADKYHHAKEEDILFVRLGKAGFPAEEGPIAVMLDEHNQGRSLVTALENANEQYASGESSFTGEIIENALGYIYLLRYHIDKENNVLYPMAISLLGKGGIDAMIPDFERVERENAGIEEKYIAILKELELELGSGN
ncbi:MAG: hemerythrin domain-containing protein [candidate division Zixibacteria bacterium]